MLIACLLSWWQKSLLMRELLCTSTEKALKWFRETRTNTKKKKKKIWGSNQRADISLSKNRNSTKSSTSIVQKLLQVITSVSGRSCKKKKKWITETDNSIAMRSLKGGLKIEAVTLTRKGEMQTEERLQNSERFSSLKDEWIWCRDLALQLNWRKYVNL